MQYWLINFILLFCIPCYGQVSDFSLVNKKINETKFSNYKPEYLFKESKSYIKYNPITAVPGGLMYLYQKIISPQIFADCLYENSCSKFSVQVIRRYGLFKGISLSADRLSRCNQFAGEDINPVRINPETNRVIDNVEWYHNH